MAEIIILKRKRNEQQVVGSVTYRFFHSWKLDYTWLRYDADNDLILYRICRGK